MLKTGFAVVFYRTDEYSTTTVTTTVTTTDKTDEILHFCETARSRLEIQEHFEMKNKNHLINAYLKPLLDSGRLVMTIPDKPNSRNQKYLSK